MNPNELAGLINDTKINTHVAVENLILIHLGLRPCSQTTIPAELPNGSSMGEEIDANFKPDSIALRDFRIKRLRSKR